MSRTVHIRVIRPCRNNTFVGHYDLMIEGSVVFKSRFFTNPVFSYRWRTPAEIDVVNESESLTIYVDEVDPTPPAEHGNYGYNRTRIYKWTKVVSDEEFDDFMVYINGWVDSVTPYTGDTNAIKCSIHEDNPFKTYSVDVHNCYYAVELWCYAMGINDMRALHLAPSSYQYMYYAAGNMVDAYSHASWVKIVDV